MVFTNSMTDCCRVKTKTACLKEKKNMTDRKINFQQPKKELWRNEIEWNYNKWLDL